MGSGGAGLPASRGALTGMVGHSPVTEKWGITLLLLAMCLCAYLFLLPRPGLAHPLGNFTVNRFSLLEIGVSTIDITYILDMAEVPAFQEIRQLDTNRNQVVEPEEERAFATARAGELRENLFLALNGNPARLEVVSTTVTFPPGEGGLATLRLEARYRTSISYEGTPAITVDYRDVNYPERIGWKEVVARPGPGVDFSSSSVPRVGESGGLTAYPTDGIASPPDVTAARVVAFATANGHSAATGIATVAPGPRDIPPRRADPLGALLSREKIGIGVVVLAIVLSAGIGSLHALTPGHGKTIMAAYLVGTRGTPWHAAMLGLTVAVSHTAGVLALGAVTLYASAFVAPEAAYPYLGLGAGALVTGIGASMLYRRLKARRARKEHHQHDHVHDGHAGAPGGGMTWRGMLAIGLADGAVPSASALVVWLAALSLNRVALGLGMVAAFGLGMAATLTVVGIFLLQARNVLGARLADRSGLVRAFLGALPWLAALLVIGAGMLMAVRAALSGGWI